MTFTIGSSSVEEEAQQKKSDRIRSRWLINTINNYVRLGVRNQKYLYPSSATECARQNFLALQEEFDSEIGIAGIGITSIGNALHDTIQEAIKATNPKALIEYSIRDVDNKLSGRADVIMEDENGTIFIMDIKTIGNLPSTPKLYHVRQLAVYSIMTGIKDGQLLYVKRDVKGNKLDMKGFVINFDAAKHKDAYNKALRTIAISLVADKYGLLPQRKPLKATCSRYCPFIDVCWGHKNAALEVSYNEFVEEDYLEEIIERELQLISAGEKRRKNIDVLFE